MKISKKILSMVLCGFIVAGGSQATLVKANAQSKQVVIVGSDKVPSAWQQGVQIKLQRKGFPSSKTYWKIKLVYKNGHLRLEGPTNIPGCYTFDDTFIMGYQKQGGSVQAPIIFRTCNNASAGNALKRAMDIFNRADIKDGDKIFMNGKKWQTTLKFTSNLLIKGITGNDYTKGYQPDRIDRNTAGFTVEPDGLYEAIVDHRHF